MTPASTIRAALYNQNVLAFLAVIRRGESSLTDDAYWILNGGDRIDDLSRHPFDGVRSPPGRAAGAYQFLGTTWAGLRQQYPQDMPDFGPASQNFAAVADIAGRGALDDIIAGRFEAAVVKLRPEWTSLPGAAENNSKWTMDAAKAIYSQFGGLYEPQRVSESTSAVEAPAAPTGAPMPILALLSAFGPIIAQLIPQIATIMQPKGEVAQRNVALAQVAFDTITKAAGAVNVQDAVDKMKADADLTAKVTQAVVTQPEIIDTLTIGPDIEKARAANDRWVSAVATDPWYVIIVKALFNPVMVVTVLTIPLVYIIVMRLVAFMDKVSADVIAQTIGTIIGLVLGGVMGFWMGQTYQQTRQRPADNSTTQLKDA